MRAVFIRWICRFISSGDMIRQGRVFLISEPALGFKLIG